jgi:hypothetical protein
MAQKKTLNLCAPLSFGVFTRRSLVAARKNCVLQNPSKFIIVSLVLFGLFAGVFVLFCFFVRDFDFQLHSGVRGVLSALSLSLSPVSLSLCGCSSGICVSVSFFSSISSGSKFLLANPSVGAVNCWLVLDPKRLLLQ